MDYTSKYKFLKPAQTDYYDVDNFNENMDKVEAQLSAVNAKADAALPRASYTAADILSKLKTVDGNASGLDADLFKGRSVIPVANGGTGASTAAAALENLKGISKLALYNRDDSNYADTSTDGCMLVALAPQSHQQLFNMFEGDDFAFIIQLFYSSTEATKSRVQIAHGYTTNKMASRHYYNGKWSAWESLSDNGKAFSAERLAVARTIRTNLAATTAASFNGTANVTPGVTGILPVANGGTGASTAAAACSNLGVTAKINEAVNETKAWTKQTFANPNLLINGDFQIWQRGLSFEMTGTGYTADRWMNVFAGATISRQQNTSPAPVKHALRIVRTASQGNFWLAQPIENYSIYSGKPLTLSLYIRGIGGFSGDFIIDLGNNNGGVYNVTQSWQKIVITNPGITFDAEQSARQGVLFATTSVNHPRVGQGVELAAVKLELGSEATPFVSRPQGAEEDLCKRYTLVTNGGTTLRAGYVGHQGHSFCMPLTASMRTNPTVADMSGFVVRNVRGADVAGFEFSFVMLGSYLRISAGKNEVLNMSDAELSIPLGTVFDAEIY